MHPALLLVLLGLACYRITRLLVKDNFPPIAAPRQWVERKTLGGRLETLGDLVTCHWCASGWVALGLVVGVDLLSTTPVPLPPIMWAAVWAVGAGLNQLEPEK